MIESSWLGNVAGMKTIGSRIRHLRKIASLSQEQFASTLHGVTRGAVGNWELDKGISRENLQAIAKRWNVSLDWLADGRGEPPAEENVTEAKLWAAYDVPTSDTWFADAKPPQRQERGRGGPRRILDLEIFAGMGNGGLLEVYVDEQGAPIDPDQVRGHWEFPEYVLRRFGDLQKVFAWEVRGDSMEPTIAGGAVVFVDTSQTMIPPDDIYAIDFGDGLMVKRVKLIPRSDRMSIISDNERYGSDDILREDVKVWGRVVGWFQWRH